MKKLLAILLATMMVFSIVACGNKNKQGTNDDEKYRDTTVVVDSVTIGTDTFRFENVDSETVIVAEFSTTNDRAHEVKIPAYLLVPGNEREQEPDKYLRVVGVGKEAFGTKSSVKSIVFPDEAAYKEHDADFNMSKHSFVIGDYAFRECVALETLSLPAYVTEIGKGAFASCSSLKTINFEQGSRLQTIKGSAFMDCVSLQSLNTPASLKEIGEGAFMDCTKLASLVINEGTLVIGAHAFQRCRSLANIELPASIGIYKDSEYINSRYPGASKTSDDPTKRLDPIGKDAFGLCDALYEEGWHYAGVQPELPEGIEKDSEEYEAFLNTEEGKAYQDALEAYNAVMTYRQDLGLRPADKVN
jgi:hypothetical protein